MTNEIDKALAFDALQEAETITGKSYKEDGETSKFGFGLHILNRQRKEELLKKSNDSYMNMGYADFLKLAEDNGFVEIHSHVITGDFENGKDDEFKIYYNPTHFSILTVESYWGGKSVNSSKLYFTIDDGGTRETLRGCSSCGIKRGENDFVTEASFDCREGFMNCFNKNKDMMIDWLELPFLWFVDYTQSKVEGYDYKELNKSVIDTFPEELLKRMAYSK